MKVINKDHKLMLYPSAFPLCVCVTFQILLFSFPLFIKCSNLIFQGTF